MKHYFSSLDKEKWKSTVFMIFHLISTSYPFCRIQIHELKTMFFLSDTMRLMWAEYKIFIKYKHLKP